MTSRTVDEKTEVQPRKHQVSTLKVVISLCLGAFLLGGFSVVCLNTTNVNIKLPKLGGGCHEHKLAPERSYFYDDYFETTYAEYATEMVKRADETTDKKDDKPTDKKDDKPTDKKDDKTTDKKDDKTTDKKDDKTTDKKDDKTTDKPDKTTDKPDKTDDKKDDKTDDAKDNKTDDKKDDETTKKGGAVTMTRSKSKVFLTLTKSNSRPSDMPEESDSKSKGPTPPLKQAGVQFALALAGIVMLNMLAICIHHIYHVASDTSKSYRNVEQDISPF